jgi:hypothetical protein
MLHGPQHLTIDCTVRDRSQNGARIRLSSMAHLGAPTLLLIPRDKSAYQASVAWQNGRELGLGFIREIAFDPATSALEHLLRRLWIERCAR